MADLSWFPYDADQWERRVRELGLSLLEEGALMRLLRHAWRAEKPCTILDRPDELARIIGHEAKKAVPVLRAHFTPLADEPGRLRCEWLYDLYLRQLEKHLSYKNRGHTGGKAKAAKRTSATAQLEAELEAGPTAQLESLSRESSTEALSCAPTEHTAKSPASGDALAPAGAALPAATNGTGNYLDRPSVREELLKRGARPEHIDAMANARPFAEVEAERAVLYRQYYAALKLAADAWIAASPKEARAIEWDVREGFGFPNPPDVELTTAQTRMVREMVYGEIARVHGWPAPEEWDGQPLPLVVRAVGAPAC